MDSLKKTYLFLLDLPDIISMVKFSKAVSCNSNKSTVINKLF